ncbi:hypothetical protein MARPU_10740 [Marichromatium purpuratum 984]|uniref:Uncharacterized protein n=1 Tax=Marichromatium purpuratum 984 TaxID=765910 RepID=W0E3U7_MARPU|nr:hypothetical protein MARPU_10740 [Marichromatium purpuratum 984]
MARGDRTELRSPPRLHIIKIQAARFGAQEF